jgi:hypothetical protein
MVVIGRSTCCIPKRRRGLYRAVERVPKKRADRVQRPAHASALIAGQAAVAPDTPGTWVQLAVVAAESAEVIGDCGLHVRAVR